MFFNGLKFAYNKHVWYLWIHELIKRMKTTLFEMEQNKNVLKHNALQFLYLLLNLVLWMSK